MQLDSTRLPDAAARKRGASAFSISAKPKLWLASCRLIFCLFRSIPLDLRNLRFLPALRAISPADKRTPTNHQCHHRHCWLTASNQLFRCCHQPAALVQRSSLVCASIFCASASRFCASPLFSEMQPAPPPAPSPASTPDPFPHPRACGRLSGRPGRSGSMPRPGPGVRSGFRRLPAGRRGGRGICRRGCWLPSLLWRAAGLPAWSGRRSLLPASL